MNVKIRKYDAASDYESLKQLIQSEGTEWKNYLNPIYKKALKNSITYVALVEEELCGYSRSISDSGLYTWVIDLLVDKKYRGHSIGKKLMECLPTDNPEQEIFVLSDVDDYYGKLGYKKEGSVFKVERCSHQ